MNKAKYLGAPWCAQCKSCWPAFEKECSRLGIEIEKYDADDDNLPADFNNVRNIPYAVVDYGGKYICGQGWDVVGLLKEIK